MKPSPGRTAVLHLLAPARVGGLEQVVRMLATNQREDDVHVAAVLSPPDAEEHPFCLELARADVPVLPVSVGARNYLGEYREIASLLARLRPRVVHTHGYRADVIGGLAARRHGIPSVSTVHGFIGGGRRNRLNERVQCLALRHADAVIGVSRSVVARLASNGVSLARLHCIPNGYGVGEQVAPASREDARHALGIAVDEWTAGWVGRISPEKGLDLALEALTHDRRWHLSVIGDGPQREAMKRLAHSLGVGERVHWHGTVNGAARLLGAFDAVVLSSRTEGTPIVLLEAMHACVPIVTTAVGGVPDMLGEDEALLVPTESPAAIAHALERLRNDSAASQRRAGNARERLDRQFAIPTWVGAIRGVYDSVASPVS